MIKRILVGIDRSASNKSVFDSAVSLAKTTGATLMLLHTLSEEEADYPVLPTYAYYPMLDRNQYDLYQERLTEYKEWGISALQNLTSLAREQGVEAEYTQLIGNPGRAICELANSWSADLILVGSRGLKGLTEMFLGSVSNYVTHHAPCSVLIVRSAIADNSNSDSLSESKSATTP